MTPKQGRRADDISAEEIKQFWHGFCERKGVGAATRARARLRASAPVWIRASIGRGMRCSGCVCVGLEMRGRTIPRKILPAPGGPRTQRTRVL